MWCCAGLMACAAVAALGFAGASRGGVSRAHRHPRGAPAIIPANSNARWQQMADRVRTVALRHDDRCAASSRCERYRHPSGVDALTSFLTVA